MLPTRRKPRAASPPGAFFSIFSPFAAVRAACELVADADDAIAARSACGKSSEWAEGLPFDFQGDAARHEECSRRLGLDARLGVLFGRLLGASLTGVVEAIALRYAAEHPDWRMTEGNAEPLSAAQREAFLAMGVQPPAGRTELGGEA